MDALERLIAIEDIRAVKARYFRFMDTKRWDDLAALFTPDMKVISPDGAVWIDGGAAFAASLHASLAHSVSVHQGFLAEIEVIDTRHATAIWAMQDVIEWTEAHPREGWKSLVGRGHYHDTYRKDDGVWRIATLQLIRLRQDTT